MKNKTTYEALNQFVKIWESGTGEGLEDCIVREPFLYFGVFGNVYELDTLKQFLKLPEKRAQRCRMEVVNETSVFYGNRAQQYAAILGYFETESSHIAFGGSFINTLVKTADGWKFKTIRFELKSDDASKEIYLTAEGKIEHVKGSGDLELLKGWKLVNDRVGCFMGAAEGQAEDVICAEYDAPWFMDQADVMEKSEEDQIKELLAKSCFSYDYSNMLLIRRMLGQTAVLRTKEGTFCDRDIIGYLKLKRQAAPRSFHAGRLEKIQVENNAAEAEFISMAPEYFTKDADGNVSYDGGRILLKAQKTDAAWKITELDIR